MLVNRDNCARGNLLPLTSLHSPPKIFELKIFCHEEADLEDDFAVYCQYSDGCADGIWHDIMFRTRTTGAALGARW